MKWHGWHGQASAGVNTSHGDVFLRIPPSIKCKLVRCRKSTSINYYAFFTLGPEIGLGSGMEQFHAGGPPVGLRLTLEKGVKKKKKNEDFPGGLLARFLCPRCRRPRLNLMN